MQTVRASEQRGQADFGWLKSRHSFSFGHYYDAAHMGFRSLRVINEDRVDPGAGFDAHPHRDMEIISYVVDGGLAHRDSTGNAETIHAGEIQVMTAGSGIVHSEYNASNDDPVHFLQMWVLPATRGLEPEYRQRRFTREEKLNRLRLVASHDGRDDSLLIHQDADLFASVVEAGERLEYEIAAGRGVWVQVISGRLLVGDSMLDAGDGLAIEDVSELTMVAGEDSEFILYDLA